MRRAGVVFSIAAVAMALVGCASADHSWRGEFDARLEGASGTLEEMLEATHPPMSVTEVFDVFYPRGEPLEFKYELVKKLRPPAGCEEVQEKGERAVGGLASFAYDVPKNLTPDLERNLRAILKEEIAALKTLEREAATCATGQ